MATDLSREDLRRLARIGAARRLEELRREEAAIRAAFPDLDEAPSGRTGGRASRRTSAAGAPAERKSDAAAAGGRKRGYKMSAAQKRIVSERMKKYWAARRKAKG